MAQVDNATLVILVVVLGAVVLLAGVLVDWRGAMGKGPTLALFGFLGRLGFSREAVAAQAGQRGLRLAEMRCATCSSQDECAKRLAAGASAPPDDCPNVALFASLK